MHNFLEFDREASVYPPSVNYSVVWTQHLSFPSFAFGARCTEFLLYGPSARVIPWETREKTPCFRKWNIDRFVRHSSHAHAGSIRSRQVYKRSTTIPKPSCLFMLKELEVTQYRCRNDIVEYDSSSKLSSSQQGRLHCLELQVNIAWSISRRPSVMVQRGTS